MRATEERHLAVRSKNTLQEATPVRINDVVVNWKRALSEVLCKNVEQTAAERNWARLCTRLRDLCPETNWIYLNDNKSYADKEKIEALHVWLERLVAMPAWPFPEQIILIAECCNEEYSWKLLFPQSVARFPFATPSHSLTIIPYYEKYGSGWHIRAVDSYIINKTGEA